MDILAALKQEETTLHQKLRGVQAAIAALGGGPHSKSSAQLFSGGGSLKRRSLSAAARARISKATKARWAKFRAEKSKKGK